MPSWVILLLCWTVKIYGASPGDVLSYTSITTSQTRYAADAFGHPDIIADLDGDGIPEIVVGQPTAKNNIGVLTFLFLKADKTLKSYRHVDQSDCIGTVYQNRGWGASVAVLGDFDGNGVPDIAIACQYCGPTPAATTNDGAVFIVLLAAGGVPKSANTFSMIATQKSGFLPNTLRFGAHVAACGDWDKNGVPDLLVGEVGINQVGRMHVIQLNSYQTVGTSQAFTMNQAGDMFGVYPRVAGDIDGNGVGDFIASGLSSSNGYIQAMTMVLSPKVVVISTTTLDATNVGGTPAATVTRDMTFGYHHAEAVGDITGDQLPDLIIPAVNVQGTCSSPVYNNNEAACTANSLYFPTGGSFLLLIASLNNLAKPATQRTIATGILGLTGSAFPITGFAFAGDIDNDGNIEMLGVNSSIMYIMTLSTAKKNGGMRCWGNHECASMLCRYYCADRTWHAYSGTSADSVLWPSLPGDIRVEALFYVPPAYWNANGEYPIMSRLIGSPYIPGGSSARLNPDQPEFELKIASGGLVVWNMTAVPGSSGLGLEVTAISPILQGRYNNITVTFTGGTASIILNGMLVGLNSRFFGTRPINNTGYIVIGHGRASTSFLQGELGRLTFNYIDALSLDYDGCVLANCHAGCTDLPPPSLGYHCAPCENGYVSQVPYSADCSFASNPCTTGRPCFTSARTNSTCEAYGMKYVCGPCPDGYMGNGITCSVIDACALNPCDVNAFCVDQTPPITGLGRICSCNRGYTGSGEPGTCVDYNACNPNPCYPGVVCTDYSAPATNYSCGRCPPGMVGDGWSCSLARSCDPNPCFPGATCITTATAPYWQCYCPRGSYGDGIVSCTVPTASPTTSAPSPLTRSPSSQAPTTATVPSPTHSPTLGAQPFSATVRFTQWTLAKWQASQQSNNQKFMTWIAPVYAAGGGGGPDDTTLVVTDGSAVVAFTIHQPYSQASVQSMNTALNNLAPDSFLGPFQVNQPLSAAPPKASPFTLTQTRIIGGAVVLLVLLLCVCLCCCCVWWRRTKAMRMLKKAKKQGPQVFHFQGDDILNKNDDQVEIDEDGESFYH